MVEKKTYEELEKRIHELEELISEHETVEKSMALSNITFEGILIHDNGIAIDVTASFLKMFGYNKEEIIGNNVIKLLLPDEYHSIVKKRIRQNSVELYEVMAIKKDGTFFPIEIKSKDIKIGNKKIRISAVRDISERKKAEQALHESEKKFAQAVQANPIPTFIIDRDHVLTHWNNACEKLTGFSTVEMLGTKKHRVAINEKEGDVLADLIVDRKTDPEIKKTL